MSTPTPNQVASTLPAHGRRRFWRAYWRASRRGQATPAMLAYAQALEARQHRGVQLFLLLMERQQQPHKKQS